MRSIRKNKLKVKKNFTTVLLIAFIPTLLYYLFNIYSSNYLLNSIANNLLIQTLFIFIFITGVINIFYPFTIREDIKKEDIKEIAKSVTKKTHKEIVEHENYRNDTL